MGWDNEFSMHRKNSLGNQEENKLKHCSECNQPITSVSTTLYEINDKHYCSDCYSQTIIKQAVERDHSDIKLEKKP
jgi:ribosomal protein L34E